MKYTNFKICNITIDIAVTQNKSYSFFIYFLFFVFLIHGSIKMRFGQILVYLTTTSTNKFWSNSEGKKLVLGPLTIF